MKPDLMMDMNLTQSLNGSLENVFNAATSFKYKDPV